MTISHVSRKPERKNLVYVGANSKIRPEMLQKRFSYYDQSNPVLTAGLRIRDLPRIRIRTSWKRDLDHTFEKHRIRSFKKKSGPDQRLYCIIFGPDPSSEKNWSGSDLQEKTRIRNRISCYNFVQYYSKKSSIEEGFKKSDLILKTGTGSTTLDTMYTDLDPTIYRTQH